MTSHKPGVPNLMRETSFSGVCCNEREAIVDDLYMCSLVRINLLEVFLLGGFLTDLCLYSGYSGQIIWSSGFLLIGLLYGKKYLVIWFSFIQSSGFGLMGLSPQKLLTYKFIPLFKVSLLQWGSKYRTTEYQKNL